MKFKISRSAKHDIEESKLWYENQLHGLGYKFKNDINNKLLRISDNPLSYQIEYKNIRKAPLRKFPYSLYYYIKDDTIFIAGCIHDARDPEFIKLRIK